DSIAVGEAVSVRNDLCRADCRDAHTPDTGGDRCNPRDNARGCRACPARPAECRSAAPERARGVRGRPSWAGMPCGDQYDAGTGFVDQRVSLPAKPVRHNHEAHITFASFILQIFLISFIVKLSIKMTPLEVWQRVPPSQRTKVIYA